MYTRLVRRLGCAGRRLSSFSIGDTHAARLIPAMACVLLVQADRRPNPQPHCLLLLATTGQEKFKGEIIHSDFLRATDIFKGKRVAIIGAGESGSDICNEISKVADKTCIVIRGKHGHLIPRQQSNGRVTDLNTNRWVSGMRTLIKRGGWRNTWCGKSSNRR